MAQKSEKTEAKIENPDESQGSVSQQAQQLKDLIARGKEQGYLTYSEVNDHMPNDIVDPEQIDDIVNMINDMGISVYETAPDSESLILSDEAVTTDDDASQEAEEALASVDAEFGRTTDPVRMYMREMGTVELLTREGEIEIAKRIEDGLNQVKLEIVKYPPALDKFMEVYKNVDEGETRLQDFIVDFIDPNAPDEIQSPINKAEVTEDEDEDETPVDTGPDPDEVKKRMKAITRLKNKLNKLTQSDGSKNEKTIKTSQNLSEKIMELKLSPKLTELLINELKSDIKTIRTQERNVMQMAVVKAGMPRKRFHF